LASRLPSDLLQSLSKLDHFNPDAFLAVHESGDQLVSVHMNSGKPVLTNGRWADWVTEPPYEISGRVPWAPDAYYLSARPSFTLDPFFHAGNYYVQEASGMFLAFALKKIIGESRNLKVLDLCAAPGGKSTLIQSLIPADSLLVSNEVIRTRVPVLNQNMVKWGRSNGIVSNNDPAHFKQLPGFFDLMLVDAPCSGSGLFRKDPDAASTWSLDLVRLCGQRQQRILADAWSSLKENGFLIYSTCSYSKEENEDILDVIFREYNCVSIALSPDPEWNIVETISDEAGAFGYRFYPDKVSGEGFFISVIQKKETAGLPGSNLKSNRVNKKNNEKPVRMPPDVEKQIGQWVQRGDIRFIQVGDSIHALPLGLVNDFEILKNHLYLKKGGVRMGKAGDTDWIPDHELALADILKENVLSLDVEKRDAIRFLRGEPFETEFRGKGWRILSFRGQRLGWVKMLEKRMNNYYPKSWRIRQ
jgi:16S rRNA C967 or C1407 C5-methylase (RsmB/RsmF family)/NOL1/NOP2/fmu family ribosome biogenesis protein